MVKPVYGVARRASSPPVGAGWGSKYWADVLPLKVGRFHVESSRHRPRVMAKVAHSSDAVHILFRVERDRFVLCEREGLHSRVCEDSCVETFLQPVEGKGYFNFEMNCGGTLHVSYIVNTDAVRGGPGLTFLKAEELQGVVIRPSLTGKKPFHIAGPVSWTVQISIPREVFEIYVGKLGALEGQWWRGNFFKCADSSKYPHWASWASVGAPKFFHQPARYGSLYFRRR